jgi:hypothetical protein
VTIAIDIDYPASCGIDIKKLSIPLDDKRDWCQIAL